MIFAFETWDLGLLPIVIFFILITVIFVFCCWLFITGSIGLFRMLRSKSWKFVIGKITDTEIRFKEFGSSGEESLRLVAYKTYSYSVNDKAYTGNQTSPSDSLYFKEYLPMDKLPSKYGNYKADLLESKLKKEIGNPTTVYYNPKKPEEACLEPGVNKEIFLTIFMGLLFGICILWLVYYVFTSSSIII